MTGIDFDYTDRAGARRPRPRSARASTSGAGSTAALCVPRRLQGPDGRPGGQRHRRGVRARARSARRVRDPQIAEALSPKNAIGCKRLCVDTGYYETFNRPNVHPGRRQRKSPIEAITPAGVKAGGREYEVDAIVFATGFDAMTGALLKIDIRGRGGLALQREVERGPAHLSRAGDGGLSQPLHDHRPGQPLGADQHASAPSSSTSTGSPTASRYMREHGHRRASSPASRRRTSGSRTSARWPAVRCATPAAPGTWAPTSPASRACSCPTSAVSRIRPEMQRGRGRRLRGLRAELGAVSDHHPWPMPDRCAQPVVRRSSSTVAA